MKIWNFKVSSATLMLFLVLVVSLVVVWFLSQSYLKDKTVPSRGRSNISAGEDERSIVKNDNKRGGKHQREPFQTKGLSAIDLRAQITNKLQKNEMLRYQILHQKEQGNKVTYMVQIDPPSIEEIKEIRTVIGAAQRSFDGNLDEREEFDRWIDDVIADYGCLGFRGYKIVMISIPNDPKEKISAYSYNCGDPNTELTAFRAADVRKITGDNVRFYVGYAGEDNIKRFQKLIK